MPLFSEYVDYGIICEGSSDECDGISTYAYSKKEAIRMARYDKWKEIDSKWFCPSCINEK